jgi:type VI secretion system protein ImpF
MAELAPRERLQPSLLDRLTDEEPASQAEPRERRVLSLRTLREGVLRDLAWLLNTTSLLSAIDAPRLPYVANSVLNYGVPDLSGNSVANLNLPRLERAIRQAIWDFEPRLVRATVAVRALSDTNAEHNKLTFEIEADMWAQPYPERLFLKTQLDLEHGAVTLVESSARGAP